MVGGVHRTPEGQRLLSFLRPLPGRLRRAPGVVVRPPRLGGLAASQPGWGALWCIGPVGRSAAARVRGGCCHGRLAGGDSEGFVPPRPVWVAGLLRVPLAACPRRSVFSAANRPVTLGGRRRTSWMHRLLPGGGPCGALPVALAWLAWEFWGCASARCGASWTGAGDRVVGASTASVRTLVEGDSLCCGGWCAAVAPGSVRVPCSLVQVWRPALHPWGMRAASVPPRCEWLEEASVCARGGAHTGWRPLVASRGVMTCGVPWGLRDLLGPWSLVS